MASSSQIDPRSPARARLLRRAKPGRGVRLVGAGSLAQRSQQAQAAVDAAVRATYQGLAAGQPPAPQPLAIGALYRTLAGCIGPRRAYDFILQLLEAQNQAAQAALQAWAESLRLNAKLDKEAQQRAQRSLRQTHQLMTRRLQRAGQALRAQMQAAVSLRAAQAQQLLRAQTLRQASAPRAAAEAQPSLGQQDLMQALSLRLPAAVPVHWAVPSPSPPQTLRRE